MRHNTSLDYKIRGFQPKDLDALARVHRTVFSQIGETLKSGRELPESGATNSKVFLAGDSAGRVVGYAMVSCTGRTAYFSWFGTLPTHRNRGIGNKLISTVHTWARKQGAKAIMLDSRNRFSTALRTYLGSHAKQTVEKWGGQLKIESTEGRGTGVTITMPC